MPRYLIDFITKIVCWIKRNRVIKPKEKVVKLNVGSGLVVALGWINIDAGLNSFFSKYPRFVLRMLYRISGSNELYSRDQYCNILQGNTFLHRKIEYGIPFPDDSVKYVYSSHMIEHLFKEDAKKFMKEVYRVLMKGGIVRICVPDLEFAISLYHKGDKEQALQFFFPNSQKSYLQRHRYLYDFDLLSRLCEEVGFTQIQRCSYKQGQMPDIEILDNRPEETLYVEIFK